MADEQGIPTQNTPQGDNSLFNEQEKPKKEHKYLKTLLTVLIGIVLIGTTAFGVWYWQQNEMKKQKSDSDKQIQELQKQVDELKEVGSDTVSTATAQPADETTNWQTYSGKDHKFTIKHPDTLYVNYYPSTSSTEASYSFVQSEKKGTQNQAGIMDIRVNNSQWESTKEFAHWAEGEIISEKETTISGQTAYVTVAKSNGSTGQTYFVIKDGIAYRISFTQIGYNTMTGEVDNSKYQDIFDKMVNTFKFTN